MNHGFRWLTILGQFSLWSISAVPVLYSYLQCFLCSYKFLYGPYLLNWVWAAVQADGPTQQSIGRNWPCKTWIGSRMEASWKYIMEGFGDHGLFVNEGGRDNVYQNLLASIDRRNLSGSSITVENHQKCHQKLSSKIVIKNCHKKLS